MRTPHPICSLLALSTFLVPSAHAQGRAYLLGAEASSNSDFGRSVGDAGDVDQDGVPDVIVGAPFHNSGAGVGGRVFIYSGRTGQLLWERGSEFLGDAFGWSVGGIGDINGDGASEVIVSAVLFDNDGAGASGGGKVYIFSPATDALLYSHWSNSLNTQFGTVVKGLGDISGDGIPDFGFTAPKWDHGGLIDCGAIFAYSGANDTTLWNRFGTQFGAAYGSSMAVIQNTNAPASTRLIVGAPQYDGVGNARGRVAILNGFGDEVTDMIGGINDSWLGYAVAGMGDVNNDGVYDFAVSSPFVDILAQGVDAGFVRMYSGATHSVLWTISGTHANADLGQALASIGDFDGDGRPDLLIGSPNHNVGGVSSQGEARVVSGATGATLASYSGALNDSMGRSVSSAGDLNLDGTLDYIIGANDAPFGAGEAYVHLAMAPESAVYCTAKVNSQGCTPQVATVGVPSLSIADAFRISATNVINQKPGLMLWGRVAVSQPFFGGTLCVGAPISRTTVQNSGGNLGAADCSGSYSFHFSHGYMASQSVFPGDAIYAQYWSRDTASSFGVGLTDAVAFHVVP